MSTGGIGASADRSGLSLVEEAVWGVTPDTPVFLPLLPVGDGLKLELSKGRLKGVRPEAVTSDVFVSKGGSNGDINLEMFFGDVFDLILEHAVRSSFDEYGVLKSGVESKSVTLEKTIEAEESTYYKRYTGMRLNTLAVDLNTESEDAITMTAGFMGETEETDTAIITGATYGELLAVNPMYMPEVRCLVVEGDNLTSPLVFKNFGFTINNGCREQQGKSTSTVTFPDISAQGIAYSTRQITVTLEAYFKDHSWQSVFTGNTAFLVSYIISNGSAGYKVTLPACKVMEEETPNEGTGSDIMDRMSLEAIYDNDTASVVYFEKIANLDSGAGISLTGEDPSPDYQGVYYKDDTLNDTKAVYASVKDASNALWWDTDTALWYNTLYSEIGTVPTTSGWSCSTVDTPTGDWTIIGTATGTLTSVAYDPTA